MRLVIGLLSPLLATLALANNNDSTSIDQNRYAVKQPPLTTPWTYKVGTNPWPEYPRPQLQRPEWQNLNGIWKYQNASSLDSVETPPFGQNLAREVLVPSCLESGLSGKPENLYSVFANDLNTQEFRATTLFTPGSRHPSLYLRLGLANASYSTLEPLTMRLQSLSMATKLPSTEEVTHTSRLMLPIICSSTRRTSCTWFSGSCV